VSHEEKTQLPPILFHLRRLRLHRIEWARAPVWVPFLREEESEKESSDDQKACGNDDQKQGSHSTSERSTPDSQNAGEPLSADYHIDPSLPHSRADIPLSSTSRDNGEEEYDYVGTFERPAQVVRNGPHR